MKKITQLAVIPILVADQDEALRFFTEKLELEKRADIMYGPGLRWLTVAPKGQKKPEIALAKPDLSLPGIQNNGGGGERMSSGTQWSPCRHSGRLSQYITCVFATDDCYKTYHTLLARGVTFLSPPTKMSMARKPFLRTHTATSFPYWNHRQKPIRVTEIRASPQRHDLMTQKSMVIRTCATMLFCTC